MTADPRLQLAKALEEQILAPLKGSFIDKETIVDLLGVTLVAGENLFILGPPGTAKSALVHELGRRLGGRNFNYLLTRFTEPGEIFGPFDIRRLREGELVTNTEAMLPEADLVFLDELLNANSAILNSLLMALNERLFRRGKESFKLPTLMVVGASNHLPEDEALSALFDRFLLRVRSDNVPAERLGEVLEQGWRLDFGLDRAASSIGVAEIRELQSLLSEVDLSALRAEYVELIRRLRYAGIAISDRRAVKLQRLIAASAILCGRLEARLSDLWVLRYIWDAEEQREVLRSIVDELVERDQEADAHPRARGNSTVCPEAIARDLEALRSRIKGASQSDRAYLRDRVGILAGRVEWVQEPMARSELQGLLKQLWVCLDAEPVP